MKLAWDLTGTEFGSRAGLYERLYSGDPEANAQRWFQSAVVAECEAMVARLLEGLSACPLAEHARGLSWRARGKEAIR